MSDREALEAAVKSEQRAMALVAMMPASTTEETLHRLTVLSYARERLVQMPEKCDVCDEGLMCANGPPHDHDDGCRCPASCHDGKVYPAELVERLRNAAEGSDEDSWPIAVLDAINSQSIRETP